MSRPVIRLGRAAGVLALCVAASAHGQDGELSTRARALERLVDPVRTAAPQTRAELLEAARDPGREQIAADLKMRGTELVVQAEDGEVLVENQQAFSPYVQGLPLKYELQPGSAATAVKLQPRGVQASERFDGTGLGDKYDRLQARFDQLDRSGVALAQPDAGEDEVEEFAAELDATREELVRSYRTAVAAEDLVEQRALLDTFRAVQRTGKAIYGLRRDDRYPPQTYERIHANSKGSVAILEEGQTVHCSGVLIGRDLVLTNHHCVRNVFPSRLRVQFDFEVNLLGDPLPSRTFVVTGVAPFSVERDGLDFSVLRVAADAEDRLPGDIYPIQCLSTARVRRDDPLYLVGHPLGQSRTVHDNTFVYFPFRVSELEFSELEMLVLVEFLDAEDNVQGLEEFRGSYRKLSEAGFVHYANFSVRWNGQPTIGVDSDTFHGNSGSPAFSRRTHRVVGILFDGQEDLESEWQVGWRAHEAVLPISEVIARLDTNDVNWRSEAGVCIRD